VSGTPGSVIPSTTVYYTLQMYNSAAPALTGEAMRFDVNCESNFTTPVTLYWLNRYGGFDSFLFDGFNQYKSDTQRKAYRRNRLGFVKKAILGGDTAAVVKKAPGIKYKLPLNGLYTTSTFVADSCDDSASGTTTFTQRVLEVKPLKDVELICAADLQTKWTNALMASGSPDTVPAEVATLIMDEKASAHQGALETAVWQEVALLEHPSPLQCFRLHPL